MALIFDGQALRRLRQDRELGRSELAEKSGVGRSTIRDLEQDVLKSGPEGPTITKLMDALGCTFEDLHKEGELPQPKPATEPEADDAA